MNFFNILLKMKDYWRPGQTRSLKKTMQDEKKGKEDREP